MFTHAYSGYRTVANQSAQKAQLDNLVHTNAGYFKLQHSNSGRAKSGITSFGIQLFQKS